MKSIIRVFILLLYIPFAHAQITVRLSTDSTELYVGSTLRLYIEANYPKDTKGSLKIPEQIEHFLILQTNPEQDRTGKITERYVLELQTVRAGLITIPSIYFVTQEDSIASNVVRIEVKDYLLNPQDSTYTAPIKPILKENLNWEDFLPFLLAILAVGAIIGLYFMLKRTKRPAKPVVIQERVLPAHEIAIRKLQQLAKAHYLQDGLTKEYQTELNYILREYIENRYAIPALESTTEEIINDLSPITGISPKLKTDLVAILQQADFVKFAKANFPEEVHKSAMRFVFEWIEATKEQMVGLS